MQGQTDRELMLQRWSSLKDERSSWMSQWKELSENVLPRNGRFFISDRNRGEKRHNKIYDSTATWALRVLSAGMMAGMSSPARPWLRLMTPDPELNRYQPVKVWLNDVTQLMLRVFAKSNTYRTLHQLYEELGLFGTAGSVVMDDFDTVIHHYPMTAGEYAIATDYRGTPNTIYREFEKTVAELVGEFGYKNCSPTVQNLYDKGSLGQWIPIIHAIEPRKDRDPNKRDSLNMPWKSCYFESGSSHDKYLRESGFREFKALVPRWAVTGGDIYGNSPAMEALGDIRQLQHEQLRKAQGIDYKTKPPLQLPASMKNQEVDSLPGGLMYYDSASPTQGIRAAFEVNLDLSHLLEDIEDVRTRIRSTFYTDMFLMLASDRTGQMTATEVAERHEEKMLMIGPVVERLQNELHNPLVELTFTRMASAGMLPPPPPEMQGVELDVEYISILAQAQRAIGTNATDRFVGSLGAVAAFRPDVLDKFDSDAWVDIYADHLGVDPSMIVGSDKVALIRDARAKQMAQQQQAEAMNTGADTAQKLANSNTGGPNALTDVIGMFSGYTS